MDPFEGQRRLEIRAEQVLWHLVSACVCGVLLLLLLFSVAMLDGASPEGRGPDAPPKIARPVEEGAPPKPVLETGLLPTRPRPVAGRARTAPVPARMGGRSGRTWLRTG